MTDTVNPKNITIDLFGKLTVSCGEVSISERDDRCRKMWRLIKYIAANRHRAVSRDELAHVLGFSDNSNSSSSLKTMIFRARGALFTVCGKEDIIIQSRGCYRLNPDAPLIIDADLFDKYIESAERAGSGREKYGYIRKALSLYKGYYLDKAFEEIPEIADRIRNYHITCINLFSEYAEYLSSVGEYAKIQEICSLAISVDPFSQVFHYHLIKACIDSGDHERAMRCYNRFHDLYHGKYRVNPPEQIRRLYRHILCRENFPATDIRSVLDDIEKCRGEREPKALDYANFCELCAAGAALSAGETDRPEVLFFSIEPVNERAFPSKESVLSLSGGLEELLLRALPDHASFTKCSAASYAALIRTGESERERIKTAVLSGFEDLKDRNSQLILTITASRI